LREIGFEKTAINNVVDPLLSITVFGDPMEISIDVESDLCVR